MSVLSHQSIPSSIVTPWVGDKMVHMETGMSFGRSACGYDIRLKQDLLLWPQSFSLASTVERFDLPYDIMARVCDKSTLARKGLQVFNTCLEPGWNGWLTLELKNQTWKFMRLRAGQPIAQVIFERLDQPTIRPYNGKYQGQPDMPVSSIREAAR